MLGVFYFFWFILEMSCVCVRVFFFFVLFFCMAGRRIPGVEKAGRLFALQGRVRDHRQGAAGFGCDRVFKNYWLDILLLLVPSTCQKNGCVRLCDGHESCWCCMTSYYGCKERRVTKSCRAFYRTAVCDPFHRYETETHARGCVLAKSRRNFSFGCQLPHILYSLI